MQIQFNNYNPLLNNSLQVRNGKKTAILAVVIDKKSKSKGKKQEKVYVIYRPNTGAQVGLFV